MKTYKEIVVEYGDYFIENLGFTRNYVENLDLQEQWHIAGNGYAFWVFAHKIIENEPHRVKIIIEAAAGFGKAFFYIQPYRETNIYRGAKKYKIDFNETKENNLKLILMSEL